MNTMLSLRTQKWFFFACCNLLIVSLAGLSLRAFHCFDIRGINYLYLLQGHSHFAFAGWGFLVLFIALTYTFIPEEKFFNKRYTLIFISGEITAWSMLISFPMEGYAVTSTTFAALYIFVTYWFSWRFIKDLPSKNKNLLSTKFVKASVFFLVISSLGPFSMGPIMAMGLKNTPVVPNAIYFYLHFQYNGWFMFGILALFFRWLEKKGICYRPKPALFFYRLLFFSCFPAYLLSVLWSKPGTIIFLIATAAGTAQLFSLIPLIRSLKVCRHKLFRLLENNNKVLGIMISILFFLKMLMQFLSSFPYFVRWLTSARNLVIAYLHLVLLGVFTLFIFAFFIEERILELNNLVKKGLWIFLSGLFITEILLFAQVVSNYFNTLIPYFDNLMFYTTILLPLGIGSMIMGGFFRKSLFAGHSPTLENSFENAGMNI